MKAAGTHSAHLSKWEATASASPVRERPRERAELAAWEAMIKAEKFEAFAKAEPWTHADSTQMSRRISPPGAALGPRAAI